MRPRIAGAARSLQVPHFAVVRSPHGCCLFSDTQVHILDPTARVHVATATLGTARAA